MLENLTSKFKHLSVKYLKAHKVRVDDYIKIDVNNEDANIKIKKLEDDIKNVIDDRIKLLTIIDTITTENRNMYRYIKKNDNGTWFSRLFR